MNPVTKISYSKYSLWQQCPLKFKYSYIDGFKEPPSPALERGSQLHKEIEDYIKLVGMPLPDCGKTLEAYLKPLQGKAVSEEFWQCDEDFKPIDGYYKGPGFIGKLDIYIVINDTLIITDIKTGKVRSKQVDQLEFYAIMGFERFPEVSTVITDLAYLDCGTIITHVFDRNDLDKLKQMWRARLKPFKDEVQFKPNVTALCGWCGFSKTKKGPCPAG